MRSRTIPRAVLMFALFCIAVATVARADSRVRFVRLSYTSGLVEIDRATGNGYEKAILNMPITEEVRLRTRSGARAEVQFEDGSLLRLAPDTEVSFPQLMLLSSGERASRVEVNSGAIYLNFRHKGDDQFRLSFGGREIQLDHSVRLRARVEGQQVELAVLKGELKLRENGQEAKVRKKETIHLDLNDSARYELAKGITPFAEDDWNHDRDEYYESINYSSGGVLDSYGSWINVPSYGYLWRPNYARYGWDPFGRGAWVWYPGYGYMWVSYDPWGWAPYRYGSWVFVNRYGWCWAPGRNWTAGPVIVNPPPAYKAPQPPATPAAGGPTIIVNRGPRLPGADGFLGRGRDPEDPKGRLHGGAFADGIPAGKTGVNTGIVGGTTAVSTPAAVAPRAAPAPGPRPDRDMPSGRWSGADVPRMRRGDALAPPSRPSRPDSMPGAHWTHGASIGSPAASSAPSRGPATSAPAAAPSSPRSAPMGGGHAAPAKSTGGRARPQ